MLVSTLRLGELTNSKLHHNNHSRLQLSGCSQALGYANRLLCRPATGKTPQELTHTRDSREQQKLNNNEQLPRLLTLMEFAPIRPPARSLERKVKVCLVKISSNSHTAADVRLVLHLRAKVGKRRKSSSHNDHHCLWLQLSH